MNAEGCESSGLAQKTIMVQQHPPLGHSLGEEADEGKMCAHARRVLGPGDKVVKSHAKEFTLREPGALEEAFKSGPAGFEAQLAS